MVTVRPPSASSTRSFGPRTSASRSRRSPRVWSRRKARPACFSGLRRTIGSASHLLERRPREEQALLADLGEAHDGLGLVAGALDVEDHALAPLVVAHVVADLQAERLRAARRRTLRSQRRLDDPVTTFGGPPATVPPAVPPPVVTPARAPGRATPPLGRVDQPGGDLVEEPARRVVLRRPEQHAAPRVAQVQALARSRDADVGESPFLLQLVGFAERAEVREHAVLEADDEHVGELEALG